MSISKEQIFKRWQKDPLLFIKHVWGLTPQPAKPEYKDAVEEAIPRELRAEWFSDFKNGKHITWQQYAIVRAVERVMKGVTSKRITVKSGHGIGKDAILSMLTYWYLFCFKEAQIGATAPSGEQMYDILWKELAKWRNLMLDEGTKSKFIWQSSHIRVSESPQTWFARAKTAKKETPEALAGLHGDHVFLISDEASGVHDVVYQTAEGALTQDNFLFIMIGNPLRREGFFFESFSEDRWVKLEFDSSQSPIVDWEYVDGIINKYGKDSDEYRKRVQGKFPQQATIDEKGWIQLLTRDEVETAKRKVPHFGEEKLGVDPADTGEDSSVGVKRSSGYAEILFSSPSLEQMDTAGQLFLNADKIASKRVYVDKIGTGTFARAKEVNGEKKTADRLKLYGVNAGESPIDKNQFKNKRAEMFWRLRTWVKNGGKLSPDNAWDELTNVKYRVDSSGRIKIMSKKKMRKEGIKSPDHADALSLTFYHTESRVKLSPEDRFFYRKMKQKKKKKQSRDNYNFKMTP